MSKNPVRVRFAPSPTGPLHIGGLRTALYNYLYAKKHNGKFILRIEDTDQTRLVKGAEKYILDALTWCGIETDEGPTTGGANAPYKQSERKNSYQKYALQLIESQHAYYAFDTPEELDTMRRQMQKSGKATWQYNAITRINMKNSLVLPQDEVKARIDNNEPYVVRFKNPRNKEIIITDIIRGNMVFNAANLDDKVLFKSDGMPTYHLANVADDYAMQISHVIRGEEWLPSLPLHVLLYNALGWTNKMPQFAHLPLILKPEGKGKLSKRDGDKHGFPVFPLEWYDPATGEKASGYREEGWLPEAVINIIALLGWHPTSNQEVFSMEELIHAFSLEKVSKSGAKFDIEKAFWFNQHYIKNTPDAELLPLIVKQIKNKTYHAETEKLLQIIPLLKERAKRLNDLTQDIDYFFVTPMQIDKQMLLEKSNADTIDTLKLVEAKINTAPSCNKATLEPIIKTTLNESGIKIGKIMPALRIILTGGMIGPGLFDIIAIIGKEETILRIKNGIKVLHGK